MSTVDTIERSEERQRRHIVLVALLAALVLILGLAGRSLIDGAGADDAEPVEVLAGVTKQSSGSGATPSSTPGQGQPGTPGTGVPAPPESVPANPRTFEISGDLEEVYPTFDGKLSVAFSNPHRFDIVVTELVPQIVAPSSGPCSSALPEDVFTIGGIPHEGVSVSQRIGGTWGSGSADLDFSVSNDLPDECQNVGFELTYTGTAIRANQS